MMIRDIILLWLIGHFLADYYFQSDTSAKKDNHHVVIKHCLIYLVTLTFLVLPVLNWPLFFTTLIISFTHFIIDYSKYYLIEGKKLTYAQTVLIYLVDQLLHVTIILLSGLVLVLQNIPLAYFDGLQEIIGRLSIDSTNHISWVLIMIIIYKPASITIRTVLDNFEPDDKKAEDFGVKNAGALIGLFERLLLLMMLSVGQYGAIGFVLTAKSVARYNRITEDPKFAEYYLLGTLLSSLIIIMSYHLIF